MSLTDAMRQVAAAGEVHCPQCHHALPYYDAANSAYFACPHCASYFAEHTGQAPKLLGRFTGPPAFVPQVLPLGASGPLPDGHTYRIIGYMARHEKKSAAYRWGEYVLLGPDGRYAQLAVYEGHWTFIRPDQTPHVILKPNTRVASVRQGEDSFELYNRYQPNTQYAVGEFSWDIRDDEKLHVLEFIAPPAMLVQEKEPTKDADWYRAEHIEPGQVAEAFGVPRQELPYRSGVGAVQPPPGEKSWGPLLRFTFGLALVAVVLQLSFLFLTPRRVLLGADYTTRPDSARTATLGQGAVIVTPSFEVQGPAALEVELHVNVNNQWLELPVNLINEQTGESREFTKSIEYYHGYESGESWAEGSTEGSALLHRLPSGRYHLNLYPQAENNQPISLHVAVIQNPPLASNLLLLLLLFFIWPITQYFRRNAHNQRRWANSDYGPDE